MERKRDSKRATLVKMTAESLGVSTDLVKRVLRMERKNEQVLATYLELDEGMNLLLQEVKRVAPKI